MVPARVVLLGLLLPLSGCGESETRLDEVTQDSTRLASARPTTPSSTSPSPSDQAEPARKPGARMMVADSEFGPMLYSSSGQAIYLFDLEDSPDPRCYDECAIAWPPVLTEGEPPAGRGVRRELLDTVERADGSHQVTYGGHPLYFYAHEDPWQVLCHDFADNGGTWFVVRPDGDAAT
jgi:predicted lipoprotein with Yx(FWY)xxD motif